VCRATKTTSPLACALSTAQSFLSAFPAFSLYRAGQIRASRKDLEVPRQRVLFLLLFVQKLSAYVLLVCCRRLSCSFPLHNLLLSELLKIAPEKIVLPLLVLDALLPEEINKALTPEL
jgi:hypothetical protein